MHKNIAIIVLFGLISTVTNANEYERSGQFSVGLGVQYGPIFGVQYARVSQSDKFFVSYGLFGLGAGYQHVVGSGNSHTLGVNYGVAGTIIGTAHTFKLLTYNYHFNGLANSGLVIGLNIGQLDNHSDIKGVKTHSSDGIVSFDIGYKF